MAWSISWLSRCDLATGNALACFEHRRHLRRIGNEHGVSTWLGHLEFGFSGDLSSCIATRCTDIIVAMKPAGWNVLDILQDLQLPSSDGVATLPKPQQQILQVGAVGRLDMPSSGLTVFPLAVHGRLFLNWQMQTYQIDRCYVVAGVGVWPRFA